jgi:soluble lytic murein transglycosylase-like protein
VHLRCLVCSLTLICVAAPARAEIVFFADGRTMSVQGHRRDAGTLVLTMRGGGEITCDPSAIVTIAPDEIPYEPEGDPNTAEAPPRAAAPVSRHGVDPHLVRAVIQVESGYQRDARSSKGAMGLMQIMPDTARTYRVADPYDPTANIEAGVAYLSALLARFPRELALAAYNAGEGAVERFRGMPPYPETRQYVARILQLAGR